MAHAGTTSEIPVRGRRRLKKEERRRQILLELKLRPHVRISELSERFNVSTETLRRDFDALVVPTIGTTFTVDEVLARPIETNTMLGHYTHFGNLLDLLGVAVPVGRTADGRPHGVTVLSAAQRDDLALQVAAHILDEPRHRPAATPVPAATEERI